MSKKIATKTLPNESAFKLRQLAEQLKTVFVALLVSILSTQLMSGVNLPLKREPWWHFVIVSVVAVLIWWFLGRKKIPRGRWWGSLCGVIAYVWFLYYISGTSFPVGVLWLFASVLFLWTLFDLFAIVLITRSSWEEGKIGKCTALGVEKLDSVSLPLGLFVLVTSVFLGWLRLLNAGLRGWLMNGLLVMGIIVMIAYEVAIFQWVSRGRHD